MFPLLLPLRVLSKRNIYSLYIYIYIYIYIFADPSLGHYYLHEEAVFSNGEGELEVICCENCYDICSAGKVPSKAVANGFDFGRPDRITPPLETLEVIERFSISQMVPYMTLFKMGNGIGKCKLLYTLTCLFFVYKCTFVSIYVNIFNCYIIIYSDGIPVTKGHAIAIEQDAVPKMMNVLPRSDLPSLLRVAWIGKPHSWGAEEMRRFAGCNQLQVRSSVIHRWLHVCKAVNKQYMRSEIDDKDDVTIKMKNACNSILENVKVYSDDNTIRMESRIGADITRAREEGTYDFDYVVLFSFMYLILM